MVTIHLSAKEMTRVRTAAARKMDETYTWSQPSMIHKRTDDEQLDIWIRSCAGELAVAKYTGGEWIDRYDGPDGFDVTPYIEVRTTTPGRNLYIKHRETQAGPHGKPPYARYFLTWIGNQLNRIELAGWLPLTEAMPYLEVHRHNGRINGYYVNQGRLWPVTSYPNRP